jgi:2-keto-4-pentenoate hydratase/2-oxohepta-3-ene-1,7-dioic acid hydratase in catechol pathway
MTELSMILGFISSSQLTCTSDLIFSIPKLIAFLSQGSTLPAGTVIITGTPAGVGVGKKPKVTLKAGDEFAVEILPHIGTLINKFENE